MTEKRAKRKLSAILSADVKGYSRLMRENELYTVRTLEAYRKVMMTAILKYRGRVVDSPGDNLLAEFASVVDAVESAVEIQKDLGVKNSELPTSRKMEFRKGNLQARKMFEKAIERDSKFALAYALNGRTHLAAKVNRLSPRTSLKAWEQRLPYKDQSVLERLIDSLRKAGLK